MTTVLLHGLGSDRRQPLELLGPAVRSALGDGERLLAPEVRAHGDSTAIGEPADFTLDRLAAEVAAEVSAALRTSEAEDTRPLTLAGISMGAAIALRIALKGLLPVERSIFVRPAFSEHSLPEQLRPFPVIGELLAERGPASAAEFRRTAVYAAVRADSPAGARGLLTQFSAPRAAARAIRLVEIPRNRAFCDDAELGALAARGIRSLVVGAPRDPVHPIGLAERWAGGLGAELVIVSARDDGQRAQTARTREAVARHLAR